jgi:hypothetical protein
MGLDLSQLREELWENTGTDSYDYDASTLDRLLNLSWWEIQDKLGFREKEGEGTFNTVPSQESYPIAAITSDINSIQGVYLRQENEWVELDFKDHTSIMEGRSDHTSTPIIYSRYNSNLYLHPAPDKVYSIKIKYLKTLDDLGSGGAPVPQSWHEIILLGAEYRLWRKMGDITRSSAIRNERDALIMTASVTPTQERFASHAAASLLFTPYP